MGKSAACMGPPERFTKAFKTHLLNSWTWNFRFSDNWMQFGGNRCCLLPINQFLPRTDLSLGQKSQWDHPGALRIHCSFSPNQGGHISLLQRHSALNPAPTHSQSISFLHLKQQAVELVSLTQPPVVCLTPQTAGENQYQSESQTWPGN